MFEVKLILIYKILSYIHNKLKKILTSSGHSNNIQLSKTIVLNNLKSKACIYLTLQ